MVVQTTKVRPEGRPYMKAFLILKEVSWLGFSSADKQCSNCTFVVKKMPSMHLILPRHQDTIVPEKGHRRQKSPNKTGNAELRGESKHSKTDPEKLFRPGQEGKNEHTEQVQEELLDGVGENSGRRLQEILVSGKGIPRHRVPHSMQPDPVNGKDQRCEGIKFELKNIGQTVGGTLRQKCLATEELENRLKHLLNDHQKIHADGPLDQIANGKGHSAHAEDDDHRRDQVEEAVLRQYSIYEETQFEADQLLEGVGEDANGLLDDVLVAGKGVSGDWIQASFCYDEKNGKLEEKSRRRLHFQRVQQSIGGGGKVGGICRAEEGLVEDDKKRKKQKERKQGDDDQGAPFDVKCWSSLPPLINLLKHVNAVKGEKVDRLQKENGQHCPDEAHHAVLGVKVVASCKHHSADDKDGRREGDQEEVLPADGDGKDKEGQLKVEHLLDGVAQNSVRLLHQVFISRQRVAGDKVSQATVNDGENEELQNLDGVNLKAKCVGQSVNGFT
ncbi:hypothetical protein TYRP_005357 [Tyrophagus putrescentiae]|nr:hypothetical protein TYRP_005357 [Tyrophagus putrescentiae]